MKQPDIIGTLTHIDYSYTPEKRLWIAVLISFVDEILYLSRKRSRYKSNKRFLPEKTEWMQEKSMEERDEWNKREIEKLLLQAKDDHIREICDLIDIDYKWFLESLEKLASLDTKTRLKSNSKELKNGL